MILFFVA